MNASFRSLMIADCSDESLHAASRYIRSLVAVDVSERIGASGSVLPACDGLSRIADAIDESLEARARWEKTMFEQFPHG